MGAGAGCLSAALRKRELASRANEGIEDELENTVTQPHLGGLLVEGEAAPQPTNRLMGHPRRESRGLTDALLPQDIGGCLCELCAQELF